MTAAQIALGGDSAGGNMTCVLAQKLRDEHGPQLALTVPLFPETALPFDTLSARCLQIPNNNESRNFDLPVYGHKRGMHELPGCPCSCRCLLADAAEQRSSAWLSCGCQLDKLFHFMAHWPIQVHEKPQSGLNPL